MIVLVAAPRNHPRGYPPSYLTFSSRTIRASTAAALSAAGLGEFVAETDDPDTALFTLPSWYAEGDRVELVSMAAVDALREFAPIGEALARGFLTIEVDGGDLLSLQVGASGIET